LTTEKLMANSESTLQRVKRVIADWSKQQVSKITLDTKLALLRNNHLEELRQKLNTEFRGEANFPITAAELTKSDPKTVNDLRDMVQKKLDGGTI